jgi:hypothetical protein
MTENEITTTYRTKSVLVDMADRYGMEPGPFESTVRAICMPPGATREEFAAFLLVAKEYRLNPLTKEIYAFPKRGGGLVPIVSIDGWVSLVNSHPACDGFDFSWENDDRGELVSCTCTMHRKDRSHPVVVTEYLAECARQTEPWKMKHRMLRHKAMIQGARYAFGFSGIYDADEGEVIAEARDVTPTARPLPPPVPEDDEVTIEPEKPTEPTPPKPSRARKPKAEPKTPPETIISGAVGEEEPDPAPPAATAPVEQKVEVDPGPPAVGSAEWWESLEGWAKMAGDKDALDEVWSDFDVYAVLAGDEQATNDATVIYDRAIARITHKDLEDAGQTSLLDVLPE